MKNKFQIIIKGRTKKTSINLNQWIDEKTIGKIIIPIFECVNRYKKAENLLKEKEIK